MDGCRGTVVRHRLEPRRCARRTRSFSTNVEHGRPLRVPVTRVTPRSVGGVLLDVLLPQRCAACELPGARALRRLPRRADPALAAALRPLRRARSLAGAALRGVQRAADRVRDRAGGDRLRRARPRGSSTRGRSAASGGSPREAASLVVETLVPPGRRRARLRAVGRRARLERGHRPAEALARELGRAWELPVAALVRRSRSVDRQRGLGLKERRRNVARRLRARRARRRRASASSTTSTRAAPPPRRPRPRCGAAARGEWRW